MSYADVLADCRREIVALAETLRLAEADRDRQRRRAEEAEARIERYRLALSQIRGISLLSRTDVGVVGWRERVQRMAEKADAALADAGREVGDG